MATQRKWTSSETQLTTFLQTFDGRVTTRVPRSRKLRFMKTTILSLVLLAAQGSLLAGDNAAENYVAHEWGTFT